MTNKALIGIVGPSGSGKSTSIRNLPVETTRIIDIERKGFPFREQSKFRVLSAASAGEADQHIATCLADKTVEVIVIESLTKYLELLLRQAKQAYKGYDIYSYYNKCIGVMLDKVKNDHAVVVFTGIDEIVRIPSVDGTESSQRRLYTAGKEWEGKLEKEMLMVLYTDVRKDKDSKMIYQFLTNSDGVCSAKTPMGMFDQLLIPNDLAAVLERAKQYYTTPQ